VISYPEDMKILETTLQDIHQLVVAIGVGRHKEKPGFEYKILGIADDSFDHLTVVEVDAHPQARNDRRMLMKMKRSVTEISIECFYKEDSLSVLGRNLFDFLGVNQPKPNRFKRILGVVPEKLFHRSKLAGLGKTPDRMIFVPDYNPMGVALLHIGHLTPYA
jgi:hypothetical protein